MTDESDFAVLHVTAAAGGGADRYIRDLAASTPHRHLLLHVASRVDVLEDIGARRFTPLRSIVSANDMAITAKWLDSAGVAIVHLHSVDEMCRGRLAALLRIRALPYLVTLHDLTFVNPRAFDLEGMPASDPVWIEALRPALLQAAIVITPSEFISEVALASNPGIRLVSIPPGIRIPSAALPSEIPSAPPEFIAQAPKHVVTVVGAVGPHKGSGVLEALAAALDGSDIGIVVIGYTDTQLARGWLVPGRLYVHGPYIDAALAGWLAAYRAEAVLFPNRLPESFSYTLSEIWACGLPAIVPDEGALGARVTRHGGGWCLPAGFGGVDAAAFLIRLFSQSESGDERSRVISSVASSDAERIPSLEAMSREVDALYVRFAQPPAGGGDADAARAALVPLLAVNLDGFAFRKELINLAGELAESKTRLAEAQQWSAKLERDVEAAAASATKLQASVEASAAWAAKVERDATAWVAKVEQDSTAWARKLEIDIAALKSEIERLADENRRLADPKAAFDLLPEIVRKYLLRRVSRARR